MMPTDKGEKVQRLIICIIEGGGSPMDMASISPKPKQKCMANLLRETSRVELER